MDPFDPERLRLPAGAVGKAKPAKQPPRHKAGERFLRGPVPWPWLQAAGRLPGKALHVAITLWHLAGMKRRRTVQWEPATGKALGVGRHAAYRGLATLEGAGLVAVDRHNGRCPIVTITDHRDGGRAGLPPVREESSIETVA